MEKSLKDKVHLALLEATGPEARIDLEDVSEGKVSGLVLSNTFASLSPSQRQDLIWTSLDRHLSPFERTRVVFIVTDTLDEYEALNRAVG